MASTYNTQTEPLFARIPGTDDVARVNIQYNDEDDDKIQELNRQMYHHDPQGNILRDADGFVQLTQMGANLLGSQVSNYTASGAISQDGGAKILWHLNDLGHSQRITIAEKIRETINQITGKNTMKKGLMEDLIKEHNCLHWHTRKDKDWSGIPDEKTLANDIHFWNEHLVPDVPEPLDFSYKTETLKNYRKVNLFHGMTSSMMTLLPTKMGYRRYTLCLNGADKFLTEGQIQLLYNTIKMFILNQMGQYLMPEEVPSNLNALYQSAFDRCKDEFNLKIATYAVKNGFKDKDGVDTNYIFPDWRCCICNKFHITPTEQNKAIFTAMGMPQTASYSHNAFPFKEGRCCERCNEKYVIPTRMKVDVLGDPEAYTQFAKDYPDQANDVPWAYPKNVETQYYRRVRKDFVAQGHNHLTNEELSEFCINSAREANMANSLMVDMLWDEKSSGLYELASRTMKSMNGENPDAPAGTQGCRPMPLHCPKSYWKGKMGPKSDEQIDDLLRERFGSTYQDARKAYAENEQLKQTIEQEKADLKQTAQEARKAVAQMKSAQKPKEKQIETLKKEVANRDKKIASMKWQVDYIKNMPPKAKKRMLMAELVSCKDVLQMDEDKEPTYYQRIRKYNNLPQWASKAYKQEKSLEAKAQEKKPVVKKKKVVEMGECLICEKKCPKNSLVEVNGDLMCRKCA